MNACRVPRGVRARQHDLRGGAAKSRVLLGTWNSGPLFEGELCFAENDWFPSAVIAGNCWTFFSLVFEILKWFFVGNDSNFSFFFSSFQVSNSQQVPETPFQQFRKWLIDYRLAVKWTRSQMKIQTPSTLLLKLTVLNWIGRIFPKVDLHKVSNPIDHL